MQSAGLRHEFGVAREFRGAVGIRFEEGAVSVSRTSISILCVVFLFAWAGAGVAVAESAEDPAMERRVKRLGNTIGEAYVCTEEKKREKFEEEAHLLFDLIVQDVGSDLAYLYAVGVGSGSTLPKKRIDCPKRLKQWKEIREDYELKGDG